MKPGKVVTFGDIGLERVALSTIITRPQALRDSLDVLTADDFTDPAHSFIFGAITQIINRGAAVDMPTIYTELTAGGLFARCQHAVAEIARTSPTVNHKDIIDRLKDLADRGRIYAFTEQLQQRLQNPAISAEAVSAEMTAKAPKPKPKAIITFTAAELARMDFKDVEWFVPRIIPKGTALLVGTTKVGKSWLALDFCITFSSGGLILGDVPIPAGRSLYIALEDTQRRLFFRIKKQHGIFPENAHFVTSWPQGEAGIAALHSWIKQHPDVQLIVIDTLGKFWMTSDFNDYSQALPAVARIKDIADTYNLTIIIIHHARKNDTSGDFMNLTLGSQALNGTSDTTITLTRKRGTAEAKLQITGRDVQDRELALRFDAETCRWRSIGEAAEVEESGARKEIIDVLESAKEPLRPKEIAELLGKSQGAIRWLLMKMIETGTVEKLEISGRYQITKKTTNTPNVTNIANTPNVTNVIPFAEDVSPLGR